MSDELARAAWRKATMSGSNGGNCIEVAPLPGGRVGLRDTERPDLPAYVVSNSVWAAFIDGAKRGEFDFPTAPPGSTTKANCPSSKAP